MKKFKLKSGNKTSFKDMGSSPAKQKSNPYKGWHPQDVAVDKLATRTDLSKVDFEKKLAKITKTVDPYPDVKSKSSMPKNFNTKGGPSKTPGYSSTKTAKEAVRKGKIDKLLTDKNISRKAFDTKLAKLTGTVDPHAKVSKTSKLIKGAKKVAGKAGKFLGGKALGVAGMMMATSSKADQPKKGKGKVEYPGGKIDFTK